MLKRSALIAAAAALTAFGAAAADRPKLILQITVDQLRGDLPTRHYGQLGEGGLKYLLDQGIHYLDAHHDFTNTETIVGHATLATGANPEAHGMVGNLWFDRATGKVTYNVEDPDFPLLSEDAGVQGDTEIDPTQAAASSDGRSPLAMLSSTFSDELAAHTAGRAKIFGVSVKDRGAVSMAGRMGKAFWFSKATGQFVTSRYYYDAYPGWVTAWNAEGKAEVYTGRPWELLHPPETYLFGDRDDQPWETDLAGFGRTFPHAYGWIDDRYYTTLLTISPAGDELTADFAKALIAAEGLGQDDVTDFLAVSFSSTDYVGHMFGASSLEAEDNILRLDRTLADFLAFVDAEVGLDNTLIALSADHGAPDAPGYLASLGARTGNVAPDTWETEAAIARIKADFGIEGPLIASYSQPYIYLADTAIATPGVDLAALEAAVADELMAFPGVALAVPATAIERGALPGTPTMRKIANNYHPLRSGNITLVFEPGYFIEDFDGLSVAVTHGSPWRYDTFVPIIFAGYGLAPQKVARKVHTVDLARTLAAVAGTPPPSGSVGDVLPEVLGLD